MCDINEYAKRQIGLCAKNNYLNKALFEEYGVKMGLRNENGEGVLTGLTNISDIRSFETVNGKKEPCEGKLLYRGYDIKDLINGGYGKKFLFEEGAYLLLFGELPTESRLSEFRKILTDNMRMPSDFTRNVIMNAPSGDIMNSMSRSVLTLASYDDRANDISVDNVLRQCLQLISIFPMLAVYAYHAHNHYNNDESMYIHRPDASLSVAENILRMLRPDKRYTELEAQALDAALLLHMEHGGGNNSTFTTRVVSSSGSDTYSVIAAAMSSLKGPKHGGANIMVMKMMEDIKNNIPDCYDEGAIYSYLERILNKDAFDKTGLIYGMGHAVYSLSDPRETVFKQFVEKLAAAKGRNEDMALYNNVEKIGIELILKKRKIFKGVCTNVDFYSGFVYDMLGIPQALFTPLFAIARIVGWSAHRIEELQSASKIIRPAYKSLVKEKRYIPREERRLSE